MVAENVVELSRFQFAMTEEKVLAISYKSAQQDDHA